MLGAEGAEDLLYTFREAPASLGFYCFPPPVARGAWTQQWHCSSMSLNLLSTSTPLTSSSSATMAWEDRVFASESWEGARTIAMEKTLTNDMEFRKHSPSLQHATFVLSLPVRSRAVLEICVLSAHPKLSCLVPHLCVEAQMSTGIQHSTQQQERSKLVWKSRAESESKVTCPKAPRGAVRCWQGRKGQPAPTMSAAPEVRKKKRVKVLWGQFRQDVWLSNCNGTKEPGTAEFQHYRYSDEELGCSSSKDAGGRSNYGTLRQELCILKSENRRGPGGHWNGVAGLHFDLLLLPRQWIHFSHRADGHLNSWTAGNLRWASQVKKLHVV